MSPVYDFKCRGCSRVEEKKIPLADYDSEKLNQRCSLCGDRCDRVMDFKGHFETKGAGWFGKEGEGTGYSITQNEMDKNGDNNKFLEDKLS